MKQELRCHAVLCPSENKARLMAKRLKEKLHQALIDFKKEKVWRQNARLSLANAGDEQKTMPFRKIMLQAGGSNYRPPLEKGKSAPKLRVIEEVIVEEDEESVEDEDEDTLTNSDNIVVQVRLILGAGTFTLGYFTLGRFTPRFYFLRTFSTQEIFICGHITLTFFHLWNKSSLDNLLQ